MRNPDFFGRKSIQIKRRFKKQNLRFFGCCNLPEWIFLILSSHFDFYAIANGFIFELAGLIFLLTYYLQ